MQNQVFTLNRLNSLLWILFWVFMLSRAMAAELVFEPATPIVETGQSLTLSVSGTSGDITWNPTKGQIQGAGNQVTYIAPAQAGTDVVTVLDKKVGRHAGTNNNVGVLKITVIQKPLVSQENANWEVFTNSSKIQAMLPSDDGKTLWVGTNGGLEQRDASTGELVRVFTSLDGLPDNYIRSLESDGSGGLWIRGTWDGLAYRSVSGKWTVYTSGNSALPDNRINALESDANGGLWIGTMNGLAYRSVSGEWTVYTTPSGLPANKIFALESDASGGLWIVAGEILVEKNPYEEKVLERGLVYRSVSGEWTFSKYFDVQSNYNYSSWKGKRIDILESDGSGGVWFTQTQPYHKQITYYSVNGEKTVYRTDNSNLPDHNIDALESDGSGGLWIGTRGGLAYRSISGEWTVYTTDNSNLPDHNIDILESDASGGLWISTPLVRRIAYRSVSGKWTVYTTNNSGKCNN